MNPRSKGSRQSAVMFHRSLTALFEAHEQTRLCIVWSPVDRTLEPAERARALTEQLIRTTPQDAVEDNITEAFLVRDTRAKPSRPGASDTSRNPRPTSTSRPLPSPTLRTAPLVLYGRQQSRLTRRRIRALQAILPLIPTTRQVNRPFHSRHTTTTVARLAVGHDFTGGCCTPSDSIARFPIITTRVRA